MIWEDCVEQIVSNMSSLERVDHTRELPTPYHYLLYEVFAAFGNWIEDGTRVDQALDSVAIERGDMQAEAVLKSAVISLAHMLRTVLESPNVTLEFKARVLRWVLEWYEHAIKREDLKQLYEMAVLKGGQRFGRNDSYYAALRETLPEVDQTRLYGEPGSHLFELIEQTVTRG